CNAELSCFFFWNCQAKIQLPTTDHHLSHDVIDREGVHSCTTGDDVTDVATVTPQELSGTWQGSMPRLRREKPVEVSVKHRLPVDRVIRPLLLIMLSKRSF